MTDFSPLVQDTTKAQSESVETVLSRLKSGRVYIPDYQRDAEQWDSRKKSLFIESILNNLTIPAFFFCEDEKRNYEVVDGQQRLSTIWDFFENKLTVSDDPKIDYIAPTSALYAGKKHNQLIPTLKDIFSDYPLTIIYLPKSLELQTKLEIFRRINEGGTPLSGQDIRLSFYIQSKSVTFIRLVGIYSSSTEAAVIVKRTKHLPVTFGGLTETALDIYCAQLQYQELGKGVDDKNILSPFKVIHGDYFEQFAIWMQFILSRGLPGISVDKYKQLALFIAGAVELNISPQKLTEKQ